MDQFKLYLQYQKKNVKTQLKIVERFPAAGTPTTSRTYVKY